MKKLISAVLALALVVELPLEHRVDVAPVGQLCGVQLLGQPLGDDRLDDIVVGDDHIVVRMGESYNTEDTATIEAAGKKLLELAPNIRLIKNDNVQDDLDQGGVIDDGLHPAAVGDGVLVGGVVELPLEHRVGGTSSSDTAPAGDKTLNLYTWQGMFPQEVLDGFTRETGIAINYANFDARLSFSVSSHRSP